MNQKSNSSGPASYHHGDLRNALIAEGRRLLEEVGARELSLRHVARCVGVSEAAPSRHFEGKEGLLAAIAADGFRELAVLRQKIVASTTDPLTRTYLMMDSYVQFAQQHKGLFDLMVGPRILEKNAHKDLFEAAASSFELFSSAVCELAKKSGWTEDQLNLVTHAAWSVEHGLATLIVGNRVPRADRAINVEEMIRFSISLLISGVAAGPENIAKVMNLPVAVAHPPKKR